MVRAAYQTRSGRLSSPAQIAWRKPHYSHAPTRTRRSARGARSLSFCPLATSSARARAGLDQLAQVFLCLLEFASESTMRLAPRMQYQDRRRDRCRLCRPPRSRPLRSPEHGSARAPMLPRLASIPLSKVSCLSTCAETSVLTLCCLQEARKLREDVVFE